MNIRRQNYFLILLIKFQNIDNNNFKDDLKLQKFLFIVGDWKL